MNFTNKYNIFIPMMFLEFLEWLYDFCSLVKVAEVIICCCEAHTPNINRLAAGKLSYQGITTSLHKSEKKV